MQAWNIVEELRATEERITRYTNNPYDGLMCAAANEIERLILELQKRDKCSFMGPMKDCPTHGESKDAARYRWVLDRMRVTPSGFLELLNNIVPNNACEMLLGERVSVAIDLAIESTRPAG